jgi:hypothetical protein
MEVKKMNFNIPLHEGWWFPVTIECILLLIIIFMPKKLTWKEIFIIFNIVGYLIFLVDTIAGRYLDIFDIGNPKNEGISELILYAFIPSSLSVIFLNFYNKNKNWILVIFFTLLSLALEYFAEVVGIFKPKKWNILFSIPIYFFAFKIYLPWILNIIRNSSNK